MLEQPVMATCASRIAEGMAATRTRIAIPVMVVLRVNFNLSDAFRLVSPM
jgi:hypothetical protein